MASLKKDDEGSIYIWALVIVGIFLMALIIGIFGIIISPMYEKINASMNHSEKFVQEAGEPALTKVINVWNYMPTVTIIALIVMGFIAIVIIEGRQTL